MKTAQYNRRAYLVAFSLLLTPFCFAQSPEAKGTASYAPPYFSDTERVQKIKVLIPLIDKIYREHAFANHFPGLVYGIMADGKLVHTGALGYTDVARKTGATSSSAFRIASMSKSFTAMAIIKLRDDNKLRLDDPAENYIPELKGATYLTADAPLLTVRHLLTHAAGFPQDDPWGDRQLADSDADLMNLIRSGVYFSNTPGVAYEYSNLGFALLGNIITRVAGKPYQAYIAENIWKPLRMNDTYWEYAEVPAQKLAHGYRWINNNWREEALLHDGSYGAMGGVITTLEDFGKYMAMHLAAWPPRNDKENGILKRSSIREMHQAWNLAALNTGYKYATGRSCPLVTSYGYGLRTVTDCGGRRMIGHSGGLPGFGSNWVMMPEYGIGVVCFANRTYAPTAGLNQQVLDTIIAGAKLAPLQLPPSAVLTQRKNELVKLLPHWRGAEKSGIFAENFFMDYPIDSLRKESRNLFAGAGRIVKAGELVPENNLRGSFTLEGEKSNLLVSFTLTPENPPLIQEYRIRELKKE